MATRSPARTLSLLGVAALISSCSGSLASIQAAPTTTTTQQISTTSVVDELVMAGIDDTVEDPRLLLLKAPVGHADAGQATSVQASKPTDAPSDTSPTTERSPSPPATTPPQPAPPGDPLEIYRGYLGTLNPGDVVAPQPAFRPQSAAGVLPYLGLPGTPARSQPVLVKVDNSQRAAPQAGLNDADIVIEEEVEWGITRFAAVFHSKNAVVGPVRSGRTTDLNFLPAVGSPVFLYSGANTVTDLLLRRLSAVDNRSAERNGSYWRQSGRRAPSNLFTDTSSFPSSNSSAPALLQYRDLGQPVNGTATASLDIGFGSTTARWDWNGSMWARSQNGTSHMTAGGDQVSAAGVVVLWVTSVDTGMVDSAGGVVPELIVLGSGPAAVLIDGQRVEGQWQRASLDSPITIVDSAGEPIGITPGRAWIELVTDSERVSFG